MGGGKASEPLSDDASQRFDDIVNKLDQVCSLQEKFEQLLKTGWKPSGGEHHDDNRDEALQESFAQKCSEVEALSVKSAENEETIRSLQDQVSQLKEQVSKADDGDAMLKPQQTAQVEVDVIKGICRDAYAALESHFQQRADAEEGLQAEEVLSLIRRTLKNVNKRAAAAAATSPQGVTEGDGPSAENEDEEE